MKTVRKNILSSTSFMLRKEFLISLLVFIVVVFAATFLFYKSAIDISTKTPSHDQEDKFCFRKQKNYGLCWGYFSLSAKYNF